MLIFIPAKQRAKRKPVCIWRLPRGSNTLWLAAGYLTDSDYTALYFRSQPVIGKSFSFSAPVFYLSVLLLQIFSCPETFASFSLPKVSPDTHFVSQNAIRPVAQPLKPHNIPVNSITEEIYTITTSFWAFSISLLHQNRGNLHHFYIIKKFTGKKPTPFLYHYV